MKRSDDLLREACGQLAQEETDQLDRSLSRAEIRQAEEAYRHHRSKALALIRKNTKKTAAPVRTVLRIAAMAAVIIGAVYLSLNRTAPENVYLNQQPTASVGPYYTPVPTDTPEPSDIPEPAETLSPTFYPENTINADSKTTYTPNPPEILTVFPTYTDSFPDIPTASPTARPTETPDPTAAPTDRPTFLPAEQPTARPEPTAGPVSASASVPDDWRGVYFPFGLPADGTADLTEDAGWRRLVWSTGKEEWVFTEYDEADVIDVPESASVSYVSWDGAVALRMEDASGVTLAWVQDGRSFSLHTSAGNEMEIAQSVKKITP